MKSVRSSQPCISMNFCTEFSKAQVFPWNIVKNTYFVEIMVTSVISQNKKLKKIVKLSIADRCTGCGFKESCLAWNFHKWIFVGALSSTVKSSIWRYTLSSSNIFRTPLKYPWWSMFNQVERFTFENHVQVDSFADIFVKIYRNLYIGWPFAQNIWMEGPKFYWPISTLTNMW